MQCCAVTISKLLTGLKTPTVASVCCEHSTESSSMIKRTTENKSLPETVAQHLLAASWFSLSDQFFSSRSRVLYPCKNSDNPSLPILVGFSAHQVGRTLAEIPNFQTIAFLSRVFQNLEPNSPVSLL